MIEIPIPQELEKIRIERMETEIRPYVDEIVGRLKKGDQSVKVWLQTLDEHLQDYLMEIFIQKGWQVSRESHYSWDRGEKYKDGHDIIVSIP